MWEINTYDQLVSVACSLVYGAGLCVLYDVLRAARKYTKPSFLSLFITDVLYFAVCAVAVFLLLLVRTNGEIRGYILFAVALGFLLFRISLSNLTLAVFSFVFKMLSKLTLKLSKAVAKLCTFILKLLNFSGRGIKAIFRSFKKVLKKPQKVLYNKEKSEKAGENANGGKE